MRKFLLNQPLLAAKPTTTTATPGRLAVAAALLLLGAAPPAAHAQKAWVTLEPGYGFGRANWGTFNQFLESYNRANGPDVVSAASLSSIRPWSVRACVLGYFTVGYDQARADLATSFTSGGTRLFNVRHNLFTLGVEPSIQREHFFVGAIGGFGFGSMRVDCPFIYADGTVSYGDELGSRFTGVYRATSLPYFFGGKIGVSARNVALTLRVEQYLTGVVQTNLSDQIIYPIPTDYERYLQTGPALYGGATEVVTTDLHTLRFQFQLGYMISPRKDE